MGHLEWNKMMIGKINKFLPVTHPGNYTGRDLNIGEIVFTAPDPYGCCDKSVGEFVRFQTESIYPAFEIPIGYVDWQS